MKRLLIPAVLLAVLAIQLVITAIPVSAEYGLYTDRVRVIGTNDQGSQSVLYCAPAINTSAPLYCYDFNGHSPSSVSGERANWHPIGRSGRWVDAGAVVATLMPDARFPGHPLRWESA